MSSSYRLKKRIESGAFDFGSDPSTHYINPFTECHPGDLAIPIGREDGVKVCMKSQYQPKDTLLENAAKGKKINALYKSYNLYYPSAEFQNRPFNPWPEGGMDRQDLLRKDYIKVPIRYNGTGLENMRQISGQEFAYGWQVVNKPPVIPEQELPWPNNFDVTFLHSTQNKGDLRDELYNKYKHPGQPGGKQDFWHTKEVKAVYPENLARQYKTVMGSTLTKNS